MKIILADKAYIPVSELSSPELSVLKKEYQKICFVEKVCATCDNRQYRVNTACENCDAYQGLFRFWSLSEIKGVEYISLPLGDRAKLKRLVPGIEKDRLDRRVKTSASFSMELTQPLYDFQEKGVAKLIKHGYGVLQSAPRTGKTVMAAALACRLGLKTLIMAHQNDLLEQFLETFHKFTDILDVEKFNSTRLVGICNKVEDFQRYEICLATYQQFISDGGKSRLEKVKKLFGLLVVDEVHKGNATCYSQVINKFHARYKFGLTATPKRKDGLEFVVEHIIGPVVHVTSAQSLKPIVSLVETHVRTSYNYSNWVYAMRFLERQEKRNELILQHALYDIEKGRYLLIPVIFQSQVEFFVNEINKRAGEIVAEGFHGKVSKIKRKEILDAARSGKIKCIIAMRSMLTGLNVPRWNSLYEVMPIANPPNFEQEIKRICTPMKDKPQPRIKFFVDELGVCKGCFRVCYKTFRQEQIQFTPKSYDKLGKYLSGGRQAFNEDEEYKPVRTQKRRL